MNDIRGLRAGRNGSGPQETTPGTHEVPVVVFGRTPKPAVHAPLPPHGLSRFSAGNRVALTFDDGPDRWTDDILDILDDHDVKATFFVVGNKVTDGRFIIERAHQAGHEIANHTWSHASLDALSNEQIVSELADCSLNIHAVTGEAPYFYRAPFLHDPPAAKMAGLTLGMLSVDCDVIGEDWKLTDYRQIANVVTRGVKWGGRLVLLHDGVPEDRSGSRRATVKAVKAIVPWLLDHGYELVTVSQLLGRVNVRSA